MMVGRIVDMTYPRNYAERRGEEVSSGRVQFAAGLLVTIGLLTRPAAAAATILLIVTVFVLWDMVSTGPMAASNIPRFGPPYARWSAQGEGPRCRWITPLASRSEENGSQSSGASKHRGNGRLCMDWNDVYELSRRIKGIEDELAIRNLVARFTDAVNERDSSACRRLWADDAVWEIGAPLAASAQGVDAIVDVLSDLLALKPMFVQLPHSGVIEFTGDDTAAARFTERERGKGRDDYYENLAVYHDEFVRLNDGWRFKRRYQDHYLDTSAFAGAVLPSVVAEPRSADGSAALSTVLSVTRR
jgi:SnoaL-like domain